DELASFHSITSSARARSAGGTSRPSAFEVEHKLILGRRLHREVGRRHRRRFDASQINLSTAYYTRCNNLRPSGSTLDHRWHWSPCSHCIGQGKCACALCREIRSCTSATSPSGRLRSQEPLAQRALRREAPQELSGEGGLQRRHRTEFCGNHSISVRRGCRRLLPLGTSRCTLS